jgi:hypothetical protein
MTNKLQGIKRGATAPFFKPLIYILSYNNDHDAPYLRLVFPTSSVRDHTVWVNRKEGILSISIENL